MLRWSCSRGWSRAGGCRGKGRGTTGSSSSWLELDWDEGEALEARGSSLTGSSGDGAEEELGDEDLKLESLRQSGALVLGWAGPGVENRMDSIPKER